MGTGDKIKNMEPNPDAPDAYHAAFQHTGPEDAEAAKLREYTEHPPDYYETGHKAYDIEW
eukprot:CAMPEP_0185779456 /NCGR_PEP_ID=MMETSP1174-20130828/95853_1 /TAXON_ID=35687 /ORGANISM="Dictyocha speculum, Strain CCMP1381" /LENGTH=59 /DNA_ID=CAMNT_0028468623 /DNA_START=442 /DNA_END=618 /DNA_ORIENTATION=-